MAAEQYNWSAFPDSTVLKALGKPCESCSGYQPTRERYGFTLHYCFQRIGETPLGSLLIPLRLPFSTLGLKATGEAERAVASLLYFIERVSKSNPSTLVPGDWPDRENEDVKKLQADPEKAGYIIRADIVHYLYTGLVEIMSVKTLVATRYKVRDTIHADIFDALQQESINSESPTKIVQVVEPRDATMSPMGKQSHGRQSFSACFLGGGHILNIRTICFRL